MLMVRVAPEQDRAWQCPVCGVAWAPVTFQAALSSSPLPTFSEPKPASVTPPNPCACVSLGPHALVRRRAAGYPWTWLCTACGTGHEATVIAPTAQA
jgi:rubredoxin